MKLKTLEVCKNCGKEFKKSPKISWKQFESREFCSNECKRNKHSEFMKNMKGDKNSNWKGDNATDISTFHKRVESIAGKPCICAICGTTDKNKTYDWACLTRKYEDINDYKRLCRSCHKKYDLARLGKGLITLKELPLSVRDKEIISSIAIKWVKDRMKVKNGLSLITDTSKLKAEGMINDFMDFFNLTEKDLYDSCLICNKKREEHKGFVGHIYTQPQKLDLTQMKGGKSK